MILFSAKQNGVNSGKSIPLKSTGQLKNKIVPAIIFICLLMLGLGAKAQWIQQGPGPSKDGQVENITDRPVVGAVNCVTPHPSNADILYIGAVSGGVWRTQNAQDAVPVWIMLSGDLSSQAIGSLEFDPTDSSGNTLVTGNGRFSSFGGVGGGTRGVFRTTTGTDPWTNLDVGGIFATRNITGIAARGATILVASNSGGLWRTADTGGTWNQISGGTGTGLPLGNTFDLVPDPSDTSVFYINAGSAGIYKSSDTGATWTKVSDAAVDGSLSGAGNIELAVGNNDNVFVAIVSGGRLSALFRSGDGGSSWVVMDVPTTSEGGNIQGIHVGGQGNTHLSLAADPSDDNVVYIGGDRQPWGTEPTTPVTFPNSLGANDYSGRLFRVDASLASGSQFAAITHVGTANNSAPHADSRDMDFDANGVMIEGDDGGVYKQTSPGDATGDWFSLNGNINVSEIHSIDWDANANIVIAGLQDNGVPEQEFPTNSEWKTVSRGDGGDVSVDDISSTTTSTRFSSSQRLGNFRMRVYSSGNVFQSQSFPALTDVATGAIISGFSFVNPVKINTQNGNRILVATTGGLFESSDQGTTLNRIGAFSINANGNDVLAYGTSDNADIIYAGSGSNVQIRNAAAPSTFSNATSYPGGTVTGIAIDPDDSQSAYVIDFNSVFTTDNTGSSWGDITGNLTGLNPGSLRSIAYIPNSGDDVLAVGTDLGVYIAPGPDFDTWASLDTNLPQVPVYDLEYDQADEILLAGTMGRGAWTFNFSERDPVDVAMVLDFSGSMLSNACSTCDPKIDVLKDAVEIFMQLWKGLAVTDDRIGSIYFRTNVNSYSSGGDVLLPVIAETDGMIADIRLQNTTGSELTAMGGGLQSAINTLTDDSRPRNILLFTDGMQNVDPGIVFPGLGIQNGEFDTASNISPTTPATVLNTDLAVKINTIGVGATTPFESQLADISSATDGLTKITTAPDEDLRQFFVEELVDALRDFSPQLVAYRKGVLTEVKTEQFIINHTSKQIVFKVSYDRGDEVGISISKGKTDVTQLARTIYGDFYQIFTFPYESLAVMKGPKYEGNWSVNLRNGASTASYEIAAITDESSLKYNLARTKTYHVGVPIDLTAEVLVNEELVTENINVMAEVLGPKEGLGTILSTTPMPSSSGISFEPGLPLGAQKLTLLQQQSAFIARRRPLRSTVNLNPGADKVFRASYTDTDRPGTYTVVYHIEGEHPYLGEFEREEQRSIVVRFADFDYDSSDVVITKVGPDSTGGYTWFWEFEPKDRYGNYLGPDYERVFDLTVSDGTLEEVKDLGNGTYVFEVHTPNDTKPKLKIQLYDEVWYDGEFPNPEGKAWFASVHAGATLPQGNLNIFYDPGIYGKLDLEWKFKKQLGLQLIAGLDHFEPNLNMVQVVLELKGYLPLASKLKFYGELGPGVHFVPKDKAYLGINAGLGFEYELSAKDRISLGATYSQLINHPLDFRWMGIGLGYHFRID